MTPNDKFYDLMGRLVCVCISVVFVKLSLEMVGVVITNVFVVLIIAVVSGMLGSIYWDWD